MRKLSRENGSTIEFSYERVDFATDRVEYEHGVNPLLITGETTGRHYGQVYMDVRADFKPGNGTGKLLIFKKRCKTGHECHNAFYRFYVQPYDPNKTEHQPGWGVGQRWDLRTHNGVQYAYVLKWANGSPSEAETTPGWPFGEVKNPNNRKNQIHEHWGEVKKQLVTNGGQDLADPQEVARNRRWVQQLVNAEIISKVLNLQLAAQGEVAGAYGELGAAVRSLYGTQLATLRFVELGIPEALETDQELVSSLIGDKAILNWQLLNEAIATGVVSDGTEKDASGKQKPIEIRGLVRPGPDGKATVPLAALMRARAERLRDRLGEAVTQQARAGSPHHSFIDVTLYRIVLASKPLGVDLKAELKKLGVTPPSHWTVETTHRDLDNYKNLLQEVLP
jgi:hypothetical protein